MAFVGYANASCSIKRITDYFNIALEDDIVSRVDERVLTDSTGFVYKIFFIHFSHSNKKVQEMVTLLKAQKEGWVYDPLEERIEPYYKFTLVEDYWIVKEAQIRIMLEDEMACIGHLKSCDIIIIDEAEYIEDDAVFKWWMPCMDGDIFFQIE